MATEPLKNHNYEEPGEELMSRTVDAVERHREALEALAECGYTQLAEDAQTLLDSVDSED